MSHSNSSLNAVGNIVGMNETVEGLQVSYAYDDLDRLTSAVNTGSSPYSRSYTYSPIGNLLSATEDGLTINYRYGQGAGPHAVTSLDGCTGSAPPENGVWTVSSQTSCGKSAVGVDDVDILGGNTLTLSGSSLNVNNILHVDGTLSLKDTDVGLDSSDDLEYDANGNLVRDGSFTYVFDEANRLVQVSDNGQTVARYYYTSDGIRYLKESYSGGDLVKTYSVGDSFEVELANGQANYTTYIRGNGELLARKDPDSSMHYYLNDHLGGTHVVMNANGELEERTTYYPFGAVLSGGDSRFTYTGQESDKETGLMYYKARYYNPSLRRFTSPDSIIPDYYNPQSLNRYSYVYNNPIKHTDPSGHFVPVLFAAVVIGGVVAEMVTLHNNPDTSPAQVVGAGVVGGTASAVAYAGALGASALAPASTPALLEASVSAATGGLLGGAYAESGMNILEGEPLVNNDLIEGGKEGAVTAAASATTMGAVSPGMGMSESATELGAVILEGALDFSCDISSSNSESAGLTSGLTVDGRAYTSSYSYQFNSESMFSNSENLNSDDEEKRH